MFFRHLGSSGFKASDFSGFFGANAFTVYCALLEHHSGWAALKPS